MNMFVRAWSSIVVASVLAFTAGCTKSNGEHTPDGALPSDGGGVGDAAPPHDAGPTDAGPGQDLGPPVPAMVTIDHAQALATLDPSFTGLSYEKNKLPTPLFSDTNTDLVGLFKRLGPSLLRVGGNSVDKETWDPNGKGLTAGTIAPTDVARLAAFLRAADWKVIYAVNMGTSMPLPAADEAKYAAKALGDRLYGFEIGNEVDLYKGHYRPTTWTYADFRTEWEGFAGAIRKAVPGAVLTGPATASNVAGYTVPFAADEKALITLLTQHYYLGNGMDPASTVAKLLSPNSGLTAELGKVAAAADGAKLAGGFRLAEANSFYNGGATGVSDSYASALWAIDFSFQVAMGGARGINFHGGGKGGGYTPIADEPATGAVIEARPEFYGLTLFSLAAQGTLRPATVTVAGVRLLAYAVDQPDGTVAVVLLNEDARPVQATVALGRAAKQATALALTGPALASTSGVLLGGAAIAKDGTWAPSTMPTLPIDHESVAVAVPAAGAVLLRAR